MRTRCLRVRRVITELFVLQNRGCKVNEMPFKHPAFLRSHGWRGGGVGRGGRTMTALCGSGLKMRHRQWHLRPSRRGFTLAECTSVVALHKRATHHVKRGRAQWSSIMQGCIDLYHLDSWQVTGSRFAGADSGLCPTFWDFH